MFIRKSSLHPDTSIQGSVERYIRVSWVSETGEISQGVEHPLDGYGGVVPSIGDKIVTMWPDGSDVAEVIDRFLVEDLDLLPHWHIVLKWVSLPPGYHKALMLDEESIAAIEAEKEAHQNAEREEREKFLESLGKKKPNKKRTRKTS